ncbi:MAG: nucleotidyltransferase [Clostridiaceae bacterium]|nr:nucleotidyltransferase [Clostridiaceae bacterium]
MKVLGLVAEHNPFHNGHLYHIEQSRNICNAEYVISIMSGNFIQRGEPAIVNKWARAKMALLSGVDLVIELPLPYAIASAEFFAYGAVKIMNDIEIVDCICFGSEKGNLTELDKIAEILSDEPEQYKEFLRAELDKGQSYPVSREIALKKYLKVNKILPDSYEDIISSSNNILGIEYLKALRKLKSPISPYTIKRVGNLYNTEFLTGIVSSATSIRKYIMEYQSNFKENLICDALPETSLNILKEEFSHGRGPVFAENYESIILALLRRMDESSIKAFPYVSEGLENRIKKSALNSGTYKELVDNISTSRYTRTRIQRILTSILTGLTSSDTDMFNLNNGPQYARVLGFNDKGRYLLSKIKKVSAIPLVLKTANFINSRNPLLRRMLEIESKATDVYVLSYSNPEHKRAGQEFTQNVIRVNTQNI